MILHGVCDWNARNVIKQPDKEQNNKEKYEIAFGNSSEYRSVDRTTIELAMFRNMGELCYLFPSTLHRYRKTARVFALK